MNYGYFWAALVGFGLGVFGGIAFMLYMLISSHRTALALVVKQPKGK